MIRIMPHSRFDSLRCAAFRVGNSVIRCSVIRWLPDAGYRIAQQLLSKSRRPGLPLLALLALLSCEEPTEWEFRPVKGQALAVEAIITDEFKTQEIRLSLSRTSLNGEPEPASDAEVKFWGEEDTIAFRADVNDPGRYFSERAFSAQQPISYTLGISWDGTTYLAESKMVEVFPFNKPTFVAAGTDSLSFGEVAPLYSPDEQAMYEVEIYSPGQVNPEARMFFYTLNTVDINELFRPPKETVAFPRGSTVAVKKYGLNPEFAAYLRALLMEAEWQGGVLDEASGSLPTNISSGGLGFFAVCAVLSDTLVAQ